jgi:hypothetical protein
MAADLGTDWQDEGRDESESEDRGHDEQGAESADQVRPAVDRRGSYDAIRPAALSAACG